MVDWLTDRCQHPQKLLEMGFMKLLELDFFHLLPSVHLIEYLLRGQVGLQNIRRQWGV